MHAVTIAQEQSANSGEAIAAPSPGDVLRDRFELREIIGRGGGSLVFRALDRIRALAHAREPEVAVKVVTASGELRDDLVALVHREACTLHELSHPNIVRGFGSDYDGDHHFLVMELLRGRPLTHILRNADKRRLSASEVGRIVRQVAAGLGYAHAKGVVHGDLKPGNVFVTRDGEVKILDFGAARALEDPSPDVCAASGEVHALTPSYASPEALAGEAPSERDDVFSLAVLAHVMLTGVHPFGGQSAAISPLALAPPSRPAGVARARWSALQEGLAIERTARVASVAQFAQSFSRASVLERLLR